MNQEQRAALYKLAEEATPGPWSKYLNTMDDAIVRKMNEAGYEQCVISYKSHYKNANYIAAANPKVIRELLDYIETLEKDAAHKQARIDALMLEFCPEEMSKEQVAEWAKHQVPAKGETE